MDTVCFVRVEVLTSNINTVLQRLQGYDAVYFGRYVPMLRRNVMGNHPANGGRNFLRNGGTFLPNYTGFTYLRNLIFLQHVLAYKCFHDFFHNSSWWTLISKKERFLLPDLQFTFYVSVQIGSISLRRTFHYVVQPGNFILSFLKGVHLLNIRSKGYYFIHKTK
jgi:hypothetical protein